LRNTGLVCFDKESGIESEEIEIKKARDKWRRKLLKSQIKEREKTENNRQDENRQVVQLLVY